MKNPVNKLKRVISAIFILGSISIQAQTPVTSVTTSTQPATPTTVGAENWGTGNDIFLENITVLGDTYSIDGSFDVDYVLKRVDNANASGAPTRLFVERTGTDDTMFEASYPQDLLGNGSMEVALDEPIMNRGALDVFHNVNSGVQFANNIERVDAIITAFLAPTNLTELTDAGFLATEKSGNNEFQAAVITSLDSSGEPASYGPLVYIDGTTSDYARLAPAYSFRFLETAPNAPHGDPTGYHTLSEEIGYSFLTFQDLGISPGQTVYGISFFGKDVDSAIHDLLDPSSFPQDTSEGADIHGGLGSLFTTSTLIIRAADYDKDGIEDQIDLDDDNDGIPDTVEAGINPNTDSDGDGIPLYLDDDDNDPAIGDTDGTEASYDADGDDVANHLDLDSDNDGIPDITEAGGTDTDSDGQIDYPTSGDATSMIDTNIDGLADEFATTPLPDEDSDNDGVKDRLDIDSDNDGIPDVTEAGGSDPDNDGIIGTGTITDSDNDGLSDIVDTNDNTTTVHLDATGIPVPIDNFDGDSNPNHLDVDSDNDGILDVLESGNGDLDTNSDGVVDANDDGFSDTTGNGQADSTEGSTPINTDGTGNANYIDIDADDDGIPDNVEAQLTSSYTAPADAFDTAGLDTNYPTGLIPVDTDGDLIPDYLDTDSDNDSIEDVVEAGQGTFIGTDTDEDGLDDGFDDTPGNDVNNDLDTGAIATDNDDDPTTTEVDFREVADSDGDGVLDATEIADGTDPNDPCDFVIASATLPVSGDYLVADCDGDGVTNEQEIADGTNPEDPCDYISTSVTLTQSEDYLISDCDEDGLTNEEEVAIGTDPNNPDTDGDTILDGQEITDGTDPLDGCDHIGGEFPEDIVCDIEFENDLVDPSINNGIFEIKYIEAYPDNTVRIYNRWGVLVFETQGYDNGNNGFNGTSNGRATISQNEKLPVGVYYYVVDYMNDGQAKKKTGYLYVNR